MGFAINVMSKAFGVVPPPGLRTGVAPSVVAIAAMPRVASTLRRNGQTYNASITNRPAVDIPPNRDDLGPTLLPVFVVDFAVAQSKGIWQAHWVSEGRVPGNERP